jgi:phosphate-selective porin OprO/OprP
MPISSRSRRRLALVTSSTLAGLICAPAFAQSAPPSADLQAQVRQLTALVQSLAEKDQAQIQALQAQVKALQAQLDAQTAQANAGQTATPRVAQNTTIPYTVPGGAPAPERGIATPRVAQNETRHFVLQSDDGRYSIGFAGVIQFDAGDYFSFRPGSKPVGPQELSDGVNARRARIGVSGTAAGGWSYAFLYDGGNSQDTTAKGIETAQVVYGGFKGVALELGYSNTQFTLDQATSGNDLVFLERASPSDIATAFNAGDFRSNAGVRFFGERYWIGGYLTGPASGDSHTATGERFGAFERAAFQVASGKDYSLHLGVGVDELLRAPNAGNGTPNTLSLSDQPELRIDPTTLLNTGAIGTVKNPVTGGSVINVETAATWKGWLWQGEYYHYDVDRHGLRSNSFDGYYGQVAYTLTGETHTYNTQSGAYYRIFPAHEFSLRDGNWGAWEIGARVSYIDLNSNFTSGESLASQPAAIEGGKQTGYTLGLNWYPNDIVRFMLDYNHIDYDKANGAAVTGAPLGAPVGARFNAVSLRSQVVF